jgi:CRISPR/Cas system-associated exonuclease Cas4 (RecB family)
VDKDRFSAVWVSHSSISDYLVCPRAYFLNNIYRNPETKHKVTLMSPPLALGQTVHTVIESLSVLPVNKRFNNPLTDHFDREWVKVKGKRGGFKNNHEENDYKRRGINMLKYVGNNPGPLKNLAVKIAQDLPHYWLSEKENIILCGKIDWLEYLPDTDTVHIIDFKTGNKYEDNNSLQLPIYHLLVHNCQKRNVKKASYWYIAKNELLNKQVLPDLEKSRKKVLAIAKEIKLARQQNNFECPSGGCFKCEPYELIINDEAELVGEDAYRQDVFIINNSYNNSGGSYIH